MICDSYVSKDRNLITRDDEKLLYMLADQFAFECYDIPDVRLDDPLFQGIGDFSPIEAVVCRWMGLYSNPWGLTDMSYVVNVTILGNKFIMRQLMYGDNNDVSWFDINNPNFVDLVFQKLQKWQTIIELLNDRELNIRAGIVTDDWRSTDETDHN